MYAHIDNFRNISVYLFRANVKYWHNYAACISPIISKIKLTSSCKFDGSVSILTTRLCSGKTRRDGEKVLDNVSGMPGTQNHTLLTLSPLVDLWDETIRTMRAYGMETSVMETILP